MKKILVILFTLFLVVGCRVDKASDAVTSYLKKYNNQNEEVLNQLEDLIKDENWSEENKSKYKEIMEKQYKDLSYKVVSEHYDGDEAIVTTKITVYDLYNAQKEAEEYKQNHKQEFLDEDQNINQDKFLTYKLEEMKKTTTTIEYTIDFKVKKENGIWKLEKLSTEQLEKIHGIYNYTND